MNLIFVIFVSLIVFISASKGNAGEYPYTWSRSSPNNSFHAVSLAGTPVETQIAAYKENHPDATPTDIKVFEREVVRIESTYSQSGIFHAGDPTNCLWALPRGHPPGWVSNDGTRLAVKANYIPGSDFSEGHIARVVGPNGWKMDIVRSGLVSPVEYWAEMLVYGTSPEVESITQNPSGSLVMTTTSDAMLELRLSDGEIIASNVLLTAAECLKTNKVALLCLLGIVLLIALLIAYAGVLLVRRIRQARLPRSSPARL